MAGNHLRAGERLSPGQKLTSANGKYELVYQADGNLVLYETGRNPVWATNTNGTPAGEAILQTDGHFCLYKPGGVFYWGTNVYNFPVDRLVLEDDRNVVVYKSDGAVAWTSGTRAITRVQSFHFKKQKRRISFAKNGHPLDYHSIAGNRWQHLQDMLRLPDVGGRQYYMGAYSQNCSDTEGGMVFVGEIVSGDTGKVIWCDTLSNRHPAGGYNHPGDLRRIDDIVVIAAQNWTGTTASDIGVALGGDAMNRGAGNRQNVLFYDVSNPAAPRYLGMMNFCWRGDTKVTMSGEIDTITASRSGDWYYLAFHGSNGLKCRSRSFRPDARWELVEEAKDNGSSPVFYDFDGKLVAGGVKRDGRWLRYDEIVFGDSSIGLSSVTTRTTRVDRMATPVVEPAFGSGVTTALSTLPGGKSYVIYANVESDARIEIEEIESDDPRPITGLYVVFGRGVAPPPGYTVVPVDLNRDAGGDHIRLCYTRDPAAGAPITSLRVTNSRTPPLEHQFTPNNLGASNPGDLNRGAGGADVFLFFSRVQAYGAPIQMVDIAIGKGSQAPAGWELLPEDLNKGAGGNFLYLVFTRH